MELGELIKSVADEQNISANQLAEMIHCNRQNVYKIFKKGNIDTALYGAKNGRFTLYSTSNIYTFIMLDHVSGNLWQVQWSNQTENFMVVDIN